MFDQERYVRESLASKYIHGYGIEIGPLHQPLKVHAKVKYVDRLPVVELRKLYPELAGCEFTEPDIIDDGETLHKIPDASQDFVIANHFLEHCQDPIGTIKAFLRVVKRGGIIYAALPNKDHTFDMDRPITSLVHLIKDHAEGPTWSRVAHFQEYADLVHHDPAEAARLMAIDYSIHFHVWDEAAMCEFVKYLEEKFPLSLKKFEPNGMEAIIILEKDSRGILSRCLQRMHLLYARRIRSKA